MKRHSFAALGFCKNDDRNLAALSGANGAVQGAVFLPAKPMAILIHMAQHVVVTVFSDDVIRGPARDPLCTFAPVNYPPRGIGSVNALIDSIEQGLKGDRMGKTHTFLSVT
jgi:hypothetical protein